MDYFQTLRRNGLLLFASTLIVMAQDTGRLTGSVADPEGRVVPGAAVQILLESGTAPVLTAISTSEGIFSLIGVRPGTYDLVVEAPGFQRHVVRGLRIETGREISLPPIGLELGTLSQTLEVDASPEPVQLSNSEISTTVTMEQIRKLPLFNRNPLGLIHTQPGVVSNGRTTTVINGLRTSFGNITLDGVNVQDNFIRDNALDFTPNLLLTDQVGEMTILTSNGGAMFGQGAAQVTFSSPPGTNLFHGSGYWFNRNSHFAANSWFNNRDGIPRAFLNQNQAGGSLGGPIVKDKLLFYVNAEALRNRQQSTANRTILTEDARQGIFTYRDGSGNVRKANVLQLGRVGVDPFIADLLRRVPGPERINNFRAGDSREDLLRNTGGFSFPIRNNRTRDNITAKLDYLRSPKHTFSGTYAWNRDVVDRPDSSNDYSSIPKVTNDDAKNLVSAAWRWNPTPRFTNELRGGFNLAPGTFSTTEVFGEFLLSGLVFSNPVNTIRGQGRRTNTYNYSNNSAYQISRHNFQFGVQAQQVRVASFVDDGITPVYNLGIGTRNPGLASSQLPGIGAVDLGGANALLATLAAYVEGYSQTFNVTSRTSGFVDGAPNRRNYKFDNIAFYLQDGWKVARRLTLNLGVRYELWGRVDEQNALALLPIVRNNNPIATLLSDSTLDFAGSDVGRPWYGADRNNFAPNIGVAWDVFGNGRTALRAGYSINYVNDVHMTALLGSVETNDGLSSTAAATGLTGRISTGRPRITVPRFKVSRTFQENWQNNPQSSFSMPDPGLRMPYVQQWTLGVQHEYKQTVFELRYVGNHATKTFRAFDYNQVVVKENGFLDDFLRAYQNGNLALNARGVFDPRFNSAISGSQPLTVFPRLEAGGLLENPVIQNLIRTGEPGHLAAIYQVNELNGAVNFFRNRFALVTDILQNFSNSTYNSLQFDVRRRVQDGLMFQANYSYSKVLSDSAGTSQGRFEPFLDIANTGLERARAPFDLTHAIKANWIYELPLGRGRRWSYQPLNRVLSGWSLSGIFNWHSGAPFSVVSGRGTLNRRFGTNMAVTTLGKGQIEELFGVRMTGNGPFFTSESVTGRDGRAVAPDGTAPFQGQVFFHPQPGQLGTLQRRMFSGPWLFDMDVSVLKTTRILENHTIELRMDAFSVFNNPTWGVGDLAIDSVNFGRIGGTITAPRVLQFGVYYRF